MELTTCRFHKSLELPWQLQPERPPSRRVGDIVAQKLSRNSSFRGVENLGFPESFDFVNFVSLSTILTKTLECFRLGHLRIECISNVTVIVKAQKDNFNFDEKHF